MVSEPQTMERVHQNIMDYPLSLVRTMYLYNYSLDCYVQFVIVLPECYCILSN